MGRPTVLERILCVPSRGVEDLFSFTKQHTKRLGRSDEGRGGSIPLTSSIRSNGDGKVFLSIVKRVVSGKDRESTYAAPDSSLDAILISESRFFV